MSGCIIPKYFSYHNMHPNIEHMMKFQYATCAWPRLTIIGILSCFNIFKDMPVTVAGPASNLIFLISLFIKTLLALYCCFLSFRSRETSNMEYIKNIVFHYMRTNSDGREQMIPAIATALHFSEDEV